MPKASVWLIRMALLHLIIGALLGAAYLSFKADGGMAWVATHRDVHIELMLVGWMIQLVIGVAYFILPRPGAAPLTGPLIWSVLLLINGGVVLVGLGYQLPGRLAETAAAGLFVLHAWNRQRAYTAVRRRLV